MDKDFSLKQALLDVLASLSDSFAAFLPRALTALAVFLVGLIVAKLAERLIRTSFDRLKVDDLLEKVGMTDILRKFGMRGTPGFLLSRLVFYLLLILFIQSAAQAVGLTAVSGSIGAFFSYLPHFVAAAIVLFIGMLVAQFAGSAVTRSARDSGIEFAPILGRIVSSLIVFMAGLMAVTQLKIDADIIHAVVLILLAGTALALALTFGLGTRDITRNLVAGFYARKLFAVGEPIEVQDVRGTLGGVTPLHVVIETEDGLTTLPNTVFLEDAARQDR